MKRISLLIVILVCGWCMSSCAEEDLLQPQLEELSLDPEDDEDDNPPNPPSGG
ncbi:MAG: hypothetical protein R8G66_22175 [Cytophagales bacterium]|nr:hypothetical protein [Cytophagales bacterium]